MQQDEVENEKQLLQIHYYFQDESHSMNAFVRNSMEKELLKLINELGILLKFEIKIESKARKEGGLIDSLILNFDSIATTSITVGIIFYIKESLNKVITYYLTGAHKRDKLENLLKEGQIRELKLKNNNYTLTDIQKKLQELEQNPKIRRALSNFYDKAEKYEKIKKIGYQSNNSGELIIERNQFKSFILVENKDIELIEEAKIEIISPVLKEGKYKWKGIYSGEKIDFSMGDSGFKKNVVNQQYTFINGTIITCELEIHRTFDDYGEEVKVSYSVRKVYAVETDDKINTTKLGAKRKKQKQIQKDLRRPSLFEFEENNQGNSNE